MASILLITMSTKVKFTDLVNEHSKILTFSHAYAFVRAVAGKPNLCIKDAVQMCIQDEYGMWLLPLIPIRYILYLRNIPTNYLILHHPEFTWRMYIFYHRYNAKMCPISRPVEVKTFPLADEIVNIDEWECMVRQFYEEHKAKEEQPVETETEVHAIDTPSLIRRRLRVLRRLVIDNLRNWEVCLIHYYIHNNEQTYFYERWGFLRYIYGYRWLMSSTNFMHGDKDRYPIFMDTYYEYKHWCDTPKRLMDARDQSIYGTPRWIMLYPFEIVCVYNEAMGKLIQYMNGRFDWDRYLMYCAVNKNILRHLESLKIPERYGNVEPLSIDNKVLKRNPLFLKKKMFTKYISKPPATLKNLPYYAEMDYVDLFMRSTYEPIDAIVADPFFNNLSDDDRKKIQEHRQFTQEWWDKNADLNHNLAPLKPLDDYYGATGEEMLTMRASDSLYDGNPNLSHEIMAEKRRIWEYIWRLAADEFMKPVYDPTSDFVQKMLDVHSAH